MNVVGRRVVLRRAERVSPTSAAPDHVHKRQVRVGSGNRSQIVGAGAGTTAVVSLSGAIEHASGGDDHLGGRTKARSWTRRRLPGLARPASGEPHKQKSRTGRAVAADCSLVGMRQCVIGIAVLAIVLGMDRRFDGWVLGARGQTIAPRVSSRQPARALAWQRHSEARAAARAEAVVARSVPARLDVGDCDSAPVCWAADSEQAQSRVAWARAVPRDAATSITRLSLGHA